MQEPKWVTKRAVLAWHREQLAEHGGPEGIRDETLLDSALAKPHHGFTYEKNTNIFRLAASYAFGITRNHPFIDGNRRTVLVVSITFLFLNGWDIVATREETYLTFLHLADGSLSEADLTTWFTSHSSLL